MVKKLVEEITSPQNPRIRKAIRLHDSRGRKQQNRIVVFGLAENQRFLNSGLEFEEFFICEELLSSSGQALAQVANTKAAFKVPKRVFEKLAFGQRVDGVVGIAKRPETSLKYWVPRKFGFVVVMEAIEKPGNVGAVFRSCVAAGADAFIAADPITDVFHPNAIRSSLGAVFSVPVFCGNSKDIVETLGAEEFQIAAAVVNAKSDFREITFSKRSAIVLGNESAGLSAIWNSPPSIPVKIPMSESIDSLNIAMSATILAYEVQRQRLHNSDCE